MKYKIQTRAIGGWCDLKVNFDDGNDITGYVDEHFDSIEEAEAELNNILTELVDDSENYRIVTTDVEQECDIYEE